MKQYEQIAPNNTLPRTSSCKSTSKIIPANYTRSSTTTASSSSQLYAPPEPRHRRRATFLRSLLSIFTIPSAVLPACKWLAVPAPAAAPSLGRKVTGTLFGHRRGHVSFAVQDGLRSEPAFVIELAVSTSALVKEMSSGLVRIALECEKKSHGGGTAAAAGRLYGEPAWTMYCNGRKCGYAASKGGCTESDWHVLRMVQSVSVGAGVIPVVDDGGGAAEGELLYMRARFERVVGSRDSEAFYMLNPDGNGGPELSIFLLRI